MSELGFIEVNLPKVCLDQSGLTFGRLQILYLAKEKDCGEQSFLLLDIHLSFPYIFLHLKQTKR